MKITVHTADFAQTDQSGKLNAIGLGWTIVGTPLPPHGVAVIIAVDWHEANEKHQFTLELLDADGHPVTFEAEDGTEAEPALQIEGQFEQGRPPGLIAGTELVQTFAVNVPGGLPLVPNQRYEYRVTVGGYEGSASFSVIVPMG